MVSIPDWTRFRATGETQKDALPPGAKYYKQRAEEAIKQAEEHGYFTVASRQLLQDKFLKNEDTGPQKKSYLQSDTDEKDLSGIRSVSLRQSHLRGVGDVGLCAGLTVCDLSSNYITKFDALAPCTQLIRLDLSGNQVSMLPGPDFWAAMTRLRILNLHDNPIGRIENLHYLSACSSLSALTLHDTPLCLKRNYRHHVVNSIWSLKALDYHVISDEEIIEDAKFGGHFSALHQVFKINLCLACQQNQAYADQLRSVNSMLAKINHILAHNSPVLIIQRHIRGLLLRRRYKMVQDIRICGEGSGAAVVIQRTFRDWKGMDSPHAHIPPPPSPVTVPVGGKGQPAPDPINLDYDTYLMNRRPGSVGSVSSSHRSEAKRQVVEVPGHLPSSPIDGSTTVTPRPPDSKKRNIHINLAKLHAGTMYGLQDETAHHNTVIGSSDVYPTTAEKKVNMVKKKPPVDDSKKKQVAKLRTDVKQFLGQVVDTVASPEPSPPVQLADGLGDEQDLPIIEFRLRGRQQTVQLYDPTTDMILAKQEAGKEIRQAEDEFHRNAVYATATPKVNKVPSQTSEQRTFARIQGTMGLTCLQAIQQAYKDREKAEKRVAKMETIMVMKEERDTAKDRIKHYQDERRNKVIRERERDQQKILEHMERLELQRQDTMEKYNKIRQRSSHKQKMIKGEHTFIKDFNVQNTSVSNALLRHDRQARIEDQQLDKLDKLQDLRRSEKEQQDVVKNYMEHRQLIRQTESAMARAAVDTKMIQEANDRLISAKARVAQLKALNSNVQAFYPLPARTNNSLPQLSPERAGSVSLKQFEKWNISKLKRHYTVAT